jgi:hypothetical protein
MRPLMPTLNEDGSLGDGSWVPPPPPSSYRGAWSTPTYSDTLVPSASMTIEAPQRTQTNIFAVLVAAVATVTSIVALATATSTGTPARSARADAARVAQEPPTLCAPGRDGRVGRDARRRRARADAPRAATTPRAASAGCASGRGRRGRRGPQLAGGFIVDNE